MKKFISLLLLLAVLFIPFNAFAELPSSEAVTKTQPRIKLRYLYETNLDLNYWEPYKILENMMPYIDWENKYNIDESLIIEVADHYKTFEMTFKTLYDDTRDFVYGVFITEEEYAFVEQGIVTETGSVIFSFSYVPKGNTVLYVVSNHNK